MNSIEQKKRQAANTRSYRLRKQIKNDEIAKQIVILEKDNEKLKNDISKYENILFFLNFEFFDTCIKNALKK